jgi:hypothetical protein
VPPSLRQCGSVLCVPRPANRGDATIHLDEWWGHPVSLDTYFFRADDMQGYVQAAGLAMEEVIERPPYVQVEYPSHRVYMLARKPQE